MLRHRLVAAAVLFLLPLVATASAGPATAVEGAKRALPPGAVRDTVMTTLLLPPNTGLALPSPDPRICYQHCLNNAKCVQWTYLPPAVSGPPECIMHYGVPSPVMAGEGMITGSISRLMPNFSILKKVVP